MMIGNYDFPNQPMILDTSWDNSKCRGRGCQVNDGPWGGDPSAEIFLGRGSQFEPTGISSPAGWKAGSLGQFALMSRSGLCCWTMH